MKFKSTELLHVFLDSEGERRKLGRLAFNNRQILFEYDEPFLASGIELSPIHLPLRPGVFRANTAIYDGLFGLFNDSVPDGWGRLLLDRTVAKHGILGGFPIKNTRNRLGRFLYKPTGAHRSIHTVVHCAIQPIQTSKIT